jgi:hypothetical protein
MAAIAWVWGTRDAQSAADWVATLPAGAERDRSVESLVTAVASRFPNEAWVWALSINDSAQRERAAAEAIKTMAARDPATARQWLETGPFTAELRKELRMKLASAK